MKNGSTDLVKGDTWPRRRRLMMAVLGWMLLNAQYLIIWGQDNALHQNALITILGAVVAVIGSYVFGAVWDDNDKRRHLRAREPSEGAEE